MRFCNDRLCNFFYHSKPKKIMLFIENSIEDIFKFYFTFIYFVSTCCLF